METSVTISHPALCKISEGFLDCLNFEDGIRQVFPKRPYLQPKLRNILEERRLEYFQNEFLCDVSGTCYERHVL